METIQKQQLLKINYKLKQNAEQLIQALEIIDQYATESNQRNEQWFIDWQDKLNEISVR